MVAVGEVAAAGREADARRRHQDPRDGHGAHEVERVHLRAALERRALDGHEEVDRHALGVRGERREPVQQVDAVALGLAEPEDAAAADGDARVADVVEVASRSAYVRVVITRS